MGIHYLAWVDDLDAGIIVLIQRHEEWIAATVNSSMYPSKRNLDSYTRGYECPEACCLWILVHVELWQG